MLLVYFVVCSVFSTDLSKLDFPHFNIIGIFLISGDIRERCPVLHVFSRVFYSCMFVMLLHCYRIYMYIVYMCEVSLFCLQYKCLRFLKNGQVGVGVSSITSVCLSCL